MENSSNTKLIECLDQAIVETKDLYLLNTLLDMKLSTHRTLSTSKKIHLNPDFILANAPIDPEHFHLVCDILEKASQVCDDFSKLFDNVVNYINSNYKDISYQSNIIQLLSYLVSFCTKNSNVDILFKYLNVEFVYNILISALNNTKTKAKAYEIFILYFRLFPSGEQIKCIDAVFAFCSGNNNLDIFCALLNHTSKESIYIENCCFNNDNFWVYVESCISGSESHLQKQGKYILSKYINSFPNHHTVKHISVSSNFENSWQAFFMLIDIGKEKQLHLVTPSLNLFKYICNLPFLWQKCVYKIYLEHSQTSIVYSVAIEILQRKHYGDNLQEIIKLVLLAINKNEYSDLSCKMFKTLRSFSLGLDKNELEVIIQELLHIKWNAVSFWKVTQNLFVHENKANLKVNSFQEIISCALNLSHIYIRTKCITYLISVFLDEDDYSKIFKIAYLLKSLDISEDMLLSHFETLKFPREITDLVIRDLIQFNDGLCDLQKTKICFMLLTCQEINLWSHLQPYLPVLNPHAALFVWTEYLTFYSFIDHDIYYKEIEDFFLKYFKDYLLEETTDSFIDVIKLLASEELLSEDIFLQVIDDPIFGSKTFNENQIYVALVLLREIVFDGNYNHPQYSNIVINIKESIGSVVINICKNNAIFSDIKVKDSRVCSECINLFFKLKQNELSYDATQDIVNVFTILLGSQGNKVLSNLYRNSYNLLFLSKSPNVVINFVNVLQQNLLQIKKDQYFKSIVTSFIKLVYSEIYFELDGYKINNITSINNCLLEFCESYPIIRLNWIQSLRNSCLACSIIRVYYEVCLEPIVDIYLQGAIITKDERTEYNLCQEFQPTIIEHRYIPYILEEYSNINLLNAASRILALETLLCIGRQDIDMVISCLIKKYLQHFKKRYFPDSKIHYAKLRIIQALLILVSEVDMSEKQTKQISSFVFNCLQEETNQNCVKQLLNWILILVLKEMSPVIEWISSRPTNVSPSILVSIIPTIFHLTLFGNEETLEKTVKMVLPWTMGAQFRLRVYAQDLIRRILEHARLKKYDNFLNKYEHLDQCLVHCIESTSDIFINTMKSDSVFLNNFHPIRDKTWASILCDISRLNKVSHTEWQNLHFYISKPNLTESISPEFADAIDIFLSKGAPNIEQAEDHQINEMLHIQKKITPWQSALGNLDTQGKTDFILVASLIDKAQNLGGLSRTCEVFGIRDIVFNNVKVTNEKEFKSLSMSSEAWIRASEVKVKDLLEYLMKLQGEGYSVIGAEQTAGSKKLNEFQFPRKMALVLGNEKTGIPPDIIPLLNVCLEIPQFGQTRSLNVHVAGATFIWEYAKQHLV